MCLENKKTDKILNKRKGITTLGSSGSLWAGGQSPLVVGAYLMVRVLWWW